MWLGISPPLLAPLRQTPLTSAAASAIDWLAFSGCWLQGGQAKGGQWGREGVHSSHSPQPQWGRGGWCKYCKSKLDWCDQRGVRLREGAAGGGGGGGRRGG